MITILKGKEITVEWKVVSLDTKQPVDFEGVNAKVFLLAPDNIYTLPFDVVRDDFRGLRMNIPTGYISTGVYDIKVIWLKDALKDKPVYRNVSVKREVFALTDEASEVTYDGDTIKIATGVESCGRDGLSAYEIAVFRGFAEGMSEKEWVESLDNVLASEESRVKAEEERVKAEDERADAEEYRIRIFTNNEQDRRQSFEISQSSRTDAFNYSEAQRQSIFESKEAQRDNNENSRMVKEEQRKIAETSRKSSEQGRETAESGRVSAESTRVADENIRKANEQDRVDAEKNRVNAETSRANAEVARVNTENTRKSNEQVRVSAENGRVSAEAARKAAEGVREATFQANEAIREANETSRQDAEVIREENERRREEAVNAKADKTAVEAAINELTNAIPEVVNDLTTGGADKALSAEMGKGLNAKINILVYPYVDKKLNLSYDSTNQRLMIDFTGFNVKFGKKSYEKAKDVVISEVGQSGENLVIPEGNGLVFNTSSATFEIIETYVSEVRETKILILSHHNNGYLNYIHPCLSEYVYTNKISAVRREVSDLQEVVATHDKAIETLDKRLISDVELGTISNGQESERTNRMRTIGYLNRENYRGFTIRGTSAIHIWAIFYDKNFNFINTRPDEGWWWATNNTDNEIDTLPENIAYLRLVFKKSDDSDITEEDVAKIQDVLSTIYPERRVTQLESQLTQLESQLANSSANIFANKSPDNVYIKGKSVFFKPDGFGLSLKRNIYWIADASKTKTEDYVYTFSSAQDLLVIDTSALSKVGSRNELSDVIKIIQIYESKAGYDYTRYIPLFYYYNKIFPLGECKDIFFPESEPKSDSELTHQYINNEILFSPEFYAYAQGRYNDNNGIGTGWYKRFSLLHISDTHQYNALVKESLSVGNEKVAAIVNTGDDANGGSPEIIKNELNATAATITSNCSIPYIGCNGNHDVPEITKKEYWDIMCSVINDKTSVVWGDADGYRTYGYVDFTSDDYEGNYRIIMLDPFDYDDGMYGGTYTWKSAVFSQKQIDWLIESLLDAANKGYHVLTAMHYSFGDNTLQFNDKLAKPDAKFYQDAFMIPDIIDAIQNKLVLNRNYLDEKGVNNITINKDFTNVADLSYVAHLFGHIHSKNEYRCQKTDGSKKYDMLMLGEATLGTYGNALNKAYKKSGTINEIAFSALEIDPIEKCIYRVAYGSYLNYDKSNSERTVKISYRFNINN